jgi:hypothetical protein
MQYQVPQFIEIEDKIFGPFTFKQFLYAGGGAGIAFILWMTLPSKFLAILIGAPIVGFFAAAAFYQVNGRPFLNFVEGALKFYTSAKLYKWQKIDKKIEKQKEEEKIASQVALPKLNQSKLKDLTWGLDVNERFSKK